MLGSGAARCKGADARAVSDVWLRRTDRTSCVRTRRTGCHTVQSKLTVKARGRSPCRYSRVTTPCVTSGLSLTSVQTAGAHRRSSVWNTACCTWNGQVETDALSRFSLTHDTLQLRAWDSPQPFGCADTRRPSGQGLGQPPAVLPNGSCISALVCFTTGIQRRAEHRGCLVCLPLPSKKMVSRNVNTVEHVLERSRRKAGIYYAATGL